MAFRKPKESEKAIRLCGNRCVVCGWASTTRSGATLVEGAHIKPISALEKDSFDDIIALCPNHHAEFDAYKFYIEPKTRRLVFPNHDDEYANMIVEIPYVKDEYLAYRCYLVQMAQEEKLLAVW